MNAHHAEAKRTFHRVMLFTGLSVLLSGLGYLQWRSLASRKDAYRVAAAQLVQMQDDAREVLRLREIPKKAAPRTRTSQELLALVERSVDAVGIPRASWRDSLPQPAVRIPNADYKREATRISLERITLRQLAAFVYDLTTNDPTLQVPTLNLINRVPDKDTFDTDLAVAYLVFAPQAKGSAVGLP